ncbi:cupin-like domain-containing protein [Paraburkholderia megapolitana]|uniref:Cupin-like domain-containing protein n=1 Tax=Paraburkholderia megapolitana TaxID=420953 RepID=A0A1I3PV63_9BURK|nr:cupin-like domain-containing protein [Paraburkholderia megapolitana]SFJ25734.1 Cupin-like domain-containing protein [Paraburkholderia megapolitana]
MTDTTNPIIKVIDLVPGERRELPSIAAQDLTREVFWNDYVCRHRPLIIKEGAAHWPAVGKWQDPGYLESLPSDAKAWLSRTFNPLQIMVIKKVVQIKKVQDCVREMREAPADQTYSMTGIPVPKEWQQDLGEHAFISPDRFEKAPRTYNRQRMFIYRNAASDWHYHETDETLTTQLSGSKRFSMFRLTPENWEDCNSILEANLHHLSCAKQLFPPRLSLVKYEATLNPGDVAYIPPFWWHGVDPEDSVVGVTLANCFRTPWERFGDWRDPITRGMTSNKPKPGYRASPIQKSVIAFTSLMRRLKGTPWYEEV